MEAERNVEKFCCEHGLYLCGICGLYLPNDSVPNAVQSNGSREGGPPQKPGRLIPTFPGVKAPNSNNVTGNLQSLTKHLDIRFS